MIASDQPSQEEHVGSHPHQQCPACHSANVHRSHARSWVEFARKQSSRRRLFRCQDCGWRGWLIPMADPAVDLADEATAQAVDLESIGTGRSAEPRRAEPGILPDEFHIGLGSQDQPADAEAHADRPSEVRVGRPGCPSCGSDLLKRAPLPLVGSLLTPFLRKRRYRCGSCGWTGWKHPLRRRSGLTMASDRLDQIDPHAAWFFAMVVLFMIVVMILLLRTWSEHQPAETPVGGLGSQQRWNELA